MTPENRKLAAVRALPLVDLTDLTEGCSLADIDALCERAQTPHGPVAAICIWPRYVARGNRNLRGTGIPVATVVNFPGGNQSIDMTVIETRTAIDDGAAEIDLVMPYGAFRAGNHQAATDMIEAVRSTCGSDALLKVILETGELADDALIRGATHMAIAARADFVKTSTGKVQVNASLDSARIMMSCIADGHRDVGFKPAGGIKSTEDCAAYLAVADKLLGADWASVRTFRFGASSVLSDLLAALDGKAAETGSGY
ncbi:MAG: deoxyribose-phosphate aldolase [Ahrensia sp.]|nr:deoxyribose-phosphate aldolase [Ahrensia sp.]